MGYVIDCQQPIPACERCGGMVRPDVVLYGESLDDATWAGAVRAIQKADALVVGGTSLSVYPAAGLLRYYAGDRLCLINKSETPYDDRANLVIHAPIGRVLSEMTG